MSFAARRLLALPALVLALCLLPAGSDVAAGKAKPRKAAATAQCRGADTMPDGENVGPIRAATRCLLNRERRKRGRPALRANRQLTIAAQEYSALMVRERFFGHVGPDGSTLTTRIRQSTRYLARTSSYRLGENLAWGSGGRSTPRQIVRAWMRSPGHRRNVLDRRFREIGVGVVVGAPVATGAPAATYTTEFGRRS